MSATPTLQQEPLRLTVGKAIVLVVLLGWIAYANSLTKVFILDDDNWIVNNDVAGDWRRNLLEHLQRPVVALTITANRLIGGLEPTSYHVLNVLIHVGAALALFGIVRRTLLLPRWQGRWDGAALPLALAVASVWVVHPLNTHSVTYVIQRCESGMGFCYALALYAMIRGSQSPRPAAWYLGSIAAAWVGVGCKENIVTIAAVALLYDRIFLADSWAEVVRRRWCLYLGLATVFFWPLRIHLQNLLMTREQVLQDGHVVSAGFSIPGLTWSAYVLTQFGVVLHYLRLSVWPVGLCFDYSDWPWTTTWRDAALPGAAILALLLASAYGCLRRNAFGFLGMTFFLALAVSSFVPLIHAANEYRTYVSLMALVAGVVIGGCLLLSRVWPAFARSTLVQSAVLASLVAGLLTLTWSRNEDYRSRLAAWQDVLEKRPRNFKVYGDIGFVHLNESDFTAARKNFETCLKYYPTEYYSILNLAVVEAHENRLGTAVELLTKLYDLHPTARSITDDYLGLYLHFDDQPAKALAVLAEAKRLTPFGARPRFQRAGVLLELPGCEAEARAELDEAVRLFPDWIRSLHEKARDRLRGRWGESTFVRRQTLLFAEIAAAAEPTPEHDATLADALAWNGRYAESLAPLRKALKASPSRELEEKLNDYEAKAK